MQQVMDATNGRFDTLTSFTIVYYHVNITTSKVYKADSALGLYVFGVDTFPSTANLCLFGDALLKFFPYQILWVLIFYFPHLITDSMSQSDYSI